MEFKSVYLNKFLDLSKENIQTNLTGNLIEVERLKEPEKTTKSGIIVDLGDKIDPALKDIMLERLHFCVVLDVGPGYTDEKGNLIENSMDTKPGEVILIPSVAIKYYKSYGSFKEYVPGTIGVTKETEILRKFSSLEEANKYFNSLNK